MATMTTNLAGAWAEKGMAATVELLAANRAPALFTQERASELLETIEHARREYMRWELEGLAG